MTPNPHALARSILGYARKVECASPFCLRPFLVGFALVTLLQACAAVSMVGAAGTVAATGVSAAATVAGAGVSVASTGIGYAASATSAAGRKAFSEETVQ